MNAFILSTVVLYRSYVLSETLHPLFTFYFLLETNNDYEYSKCVLLYTWAANIL